jgi:hypothetical protein
MLDALWFSIYWMAIYSTVSNTIFLWFRFVSILFFQHYLESVPEWETQLGHVALSPGRITQQELPSSSPPGESPYASLRDSLAFIITAIAALFVVVVLFTAIVIDSKNSETQARRQSYGDNP